MQRRRISLAIVFLAALFLTLRSLPLVAEEDACLHRTVPVNVLTERGLQYPNLASADFKASLHGKLVRIVSVRPNDVSPRVMIVVDASGSMFGDADGWTLNLGIARALLHYLPSDSLVGLAVFAKTVETNLPPMLDRERVSSEVTRLGTFHAKMPPGKHSTALWDSLKAVISDFGSPRVGDSIFLITDGEDNESSVRFRAVERAILASGLRVFASYFDSPDGGPRPEERLGVSELRDLVQETGGYQLVIDAPLQVPKAGISMSGNSNAELQLEHQARQLVAYYNVEVELPERLDKSSGWKLKATGPKHGELLMFYPRELMPCSPSESATNTH